MNSVQMINANYDILNNLRVRGKYPKLYDEVLQHDKQCFSSWYELSDEAYKEYLEYVQEGKEND